MNRVLLFRAACALCAAAANCASGMSISDAKLLANDQPVSLTAKVVTYAAADFLYVEEDSRCMGIRVEKTAHGLAVGMRADVSGIMKTNTNRERYILATGAVHNGDAELAPVGMNNSALGGADWQVVETGGQRGVAETPGPNNVGLLIATSGHYQQMDATTFTLDDGSGVLRCTVPSGTFLYSGWEYVAVTGISSMFKYSRFIYPPTVLARDIQVLLPLESVSVPGTPSGNTSPLVNVGETYSTTGSTCTQGHPVEYSFNWGDGSSSPWSTSTIASHSWSSAGLVTVTVTARCKAHPSVSATSAGLQVTPLWTVSQIAAGGEHCLALKNDGTVWAWGNNGAGQLGDGTSNNVRLTPVQVSGLTGVTAIAAGDWHSLALKSEGTVWACGYNHLGQLGDGTTASRWTPVQVSGLSGVTAIAAGDSHSLALKSDGTVWAWGNNSRGQLGDGTYDWRTTPVQVSGLTGVTAIAAGHWHSLALKSDGTVWAWGDNQYGQIGDGTGTGRLTPVQVSALTGATAIAAGGDHSLATESDGTLWSWGDNQYGQLGEGTSPYRSTPIQVSALAGITAIAAGWNHSLALKSDGTLWAWGQNYGQLGDGTTTKRSTPVQVSGLTGATATAAGQQHSLALKSNGTVWAWGDNFYGQLGDGTTTQRLTPVQVIGL